MTATESDPGRVCREVRAQLPDAVAGALPGWRERLVARHLRRCEDCEAELARQQTLAAGLEELGEVTAGETEEQPPDTLLDALLEQAGHPGVRARAAVPARGAVSGERPALSVALLLLGAVVGTAVGYAGWRGARAVRRRLDRAGR